MKAPLTLATLMIAGALPLAAEHRHTTHVYYGPPPVRGPAVAVSVNTPYGGGYFYRGFPAPAYYGCAGCVQGAAYGYGPAHKFAKRGKWKKWKAKRLYYHPR